MASPFVELEIGSRTVKVTNPDRVYFPARGETKLDLANYYLSVGDGIVRALYEPAVHASPISGGRRRREDLPEATAQRRAGVGRDGVEVSFPSGRTADELCVTELASVVWAVQMSTVEFHPWHTRRPEVEMPDELRIDLDPQPGTDFADAQDVAMLVREVLADVGAVGWPKTSGNRGIHIYVRIEPDFGFREVRRAALAFAREVERRRPELVTTAWWKEERGEQIFLDFNQNAKDRTIAAAYSVRGFDHGPVSAPLTWDELPDVKTADFTIATMPERFARLGDVHAGIDDVAFDIRPLLEWADRDEADHGLGDAPYPPNYPKMPGEPMRVQPSRAKRPTSTNTSD